MPCSCVSFDYGPLPDLMENRTETVVLSEPATCCECGDTLPAGTKAERAWFVPYGVWNKIQYDEWEGPIPEDPRPLHTCPTCKEIIDKLCCGAREYETLYDVLYHNIDDMDPCCLDGLSLEAAHKLDEFVLFDEDE